MKKILLLVISIAMLGIVGCSSTDTDQEKSNEKPKKEEIVLTDEEKNIIIENINDMTLGTGFEGAVLEVNSKQEEFPGAVDNLLEISVIKSINDIAGGYGTLNADDTVKAIRKSLTFDTALTIASEEVGKIGEFDIIKANIYDSEETFKNDEKWTSKTVKLNK